MVATRDTQVATSEESRIQELLRGAGEFFETSLWESKGTGGAHRVLSRENLDEEVIRSFGVGYAPMAPYELIGHLGELGYSEDEIVASGLANRSVRGRLHAHFRSRVMFPVRDREGRILGFAGLGTHLGPSWSLWVTSPDNGIYRRSAAVFGLDRAADEIADSRIALVRRDSIDVLRSHQDGDANAVTVHSGSVTPEQAAAMAEGIPGGVDALELDLPPGMPVDAAEQRTDAPKTRRAASADRAAGRDEPDRLLEFKKVAIVIATALAAINVWTVAPLIAIWLGSQAQGGQVVSLRGVFTVLVVMGVLAFLLAWALTWLHAKYDALIGRPPIVGQTSPWGRRMRGELNEQFRTVYGLSAPERAVAACVLAAVLALEVWFFFFAGSSIG